MTRAFAALLALGTLLALAPAAGAGSPGPFEALGLVRFDSGVRAPAFEPTPRSMSPARLDRADPPPHRRPERR